MSALIEKIKNSKYSNEKLRFLLFAFALFLVLFLARYLLGMAFARYEVRAKINANIDKALYIFEDDVMSFNLEPEGIVPSDDPYVYRFSVSNFNETKQSDVDIQYKVSVRTTTNLPITVELYRNELYNATGATNIFQGAVSKRDTDNTWYRLYTCADEYEMDYEDRVTDVYTLVIRFPAAYAEDTTYANSIESIEVILDSKQII